MQVDTNFERGDIIYVKSEAEQGNLIDVTVREIDIKVETPNISIIQYLVYSNNQYNDSTFYEEDLMTLAAARITATASLNAQIQEINSEISDL